MTGCEIIKEFTDPGLKYGLAENCKTSIPGSNPGGASNFPQYFCTFRSRFWRTNGVARPIARPDSLDRGGVTKAKVIAPCARRKNVEQGRFVM
jgi:G:T/U-mismatch repair DNA glycosylase